MDGQRLICIKYSTLLRTENHSLPYKTSRRFVFLNNSYRENNLRDVTSHPDKKMPDLVQARRIMPKSGSLFTSAAWRSWSPVCDCRPIALRHRLSPGLPLSDVCSAYSNLVFSIPYRKILLEGCLRSAYRFSLT